MLSGLGPETVMVVIVSSGVDKDMNNTCYVVPPPRKHSRCYVFVSDKVAWCTPDKGSSVVRAMSSDKVHCGEAALFNEDTR